MNTTPAQPRSHHPFLTPTQPYNDEAAQRATTLALGIIGSLAILVLLPPPASIILATAVVIATLVTISESEDLSPAPRERVIERTVYVDKRPSLFSDPFFTPRGPVSWNCEPRPVDRFPSRPDFVGEPSRAAREPVGERDRGFNFRDLIPNQTTGPQGGERVPVGRR